MHLSHGLTNACIVCVLQVAVILKMTFFSSLIRLVILPAIFIPLTLAASSAGYLTKDPVVVFVLCLESSVRPPAAVEQPSSQPLALC